MLIFLFIGLLSALIFKPKDKNEIVEIEIDVIENQICQGFFKPAKGYNIGYEVSISTLDEESEKKKFYFYNSSVPFDVKTHFSFNNVDPQKLILQIIPFVLTEENSRYTTGEIEFKFDTQFDTFNKEVAKGVRVEPAIHALTKIEELLFQIKVQTEARADKMNAVTTEHRMVVSFVSLCSIVTLCVFFGVNIYQLHSIKKFFKRKKLI
jgi:hypothetical protein